MPLQTDSFLLLLGAFFLVAVFYSSVGFGGGSSYLAILSLFAFSFFFIRTNALICNMVVVSGSTYLFLKNRQFDWKAFFPFIVTSIPMAFLGSALKISEQVFFILLGMSLITSAFFLGWQARAKTLTNEKKIPVWFSYILGGFIGLLSGMVGIGGGIFLAPLLNHLNWGKPIKIAALAAFFILMNSISGLVSQIINGNWEADWRVTLCLIAAVLLGGQLGVRFTLKKSSPRMIRLGTALLIFIVGLRTLLYKGIFS